MAHDVFISYADSDRTAAIGIVATLENNGIRCWFAPRDVAPGTSSMAAKSAAIDEAQVVVLVFSEAANTSGLVQRDMERAVARQRSVIPIRLEDVAPGASLEYALAGTHWLDAMTEPLENHLRRLVEATSALIGGTNSTRAPQAMRSVPPAQPQAVPPTPQPQVDPDPAQAPYATPSPTEEIPSGPQAVPTPAQEASAPAHAVPAPPQGQPYVFPTPPQTAPPGGSPRRHETAKLWGLRALWVLLPAVPFGQFAAILFIVAAFKRPERKWIITAAVMSVLDGIIIIWVYSADPNSAIPFMLIVWIGGIVTALVMAGQWFREAPHRQTQGQSESQATHNQVSDQT